MRKFTPPSQKKTPGVCHNVGTPVRLGMETGLPADREVCAPFDQTVGSVKGEILPDESYDRSPARLGLTALNRELL